VRGNLNAAVDGFAAGALLVMLIDFLIPDAVRRERVVRRSAGCG
jgi:ZIP family zinc transporter